MNFTIKRGGIFNRIFLALGLALTTAGAHTEVPVPDITGLSPLAGPTGTAVTLKGKNFSPVAGGNIVYFGLVRGMVTKATATELTVIVPPGATFAPVTETVNGLSASSTTPFLPTFPGGGALSQVSLGPQFTLPSGPNAGFSTLADLDGDGKPDLIVCAYDQNIYIYRNISTNGILGPGSFAPAVRLPVPTGNGNFGMIQAVDLTGDGKLDLVTSDYLNNNLIVLKNRATPGCLTTNSFAPAVFFPTGTTPIGVAVGDLDGDGRPDIITAANGGNTISVYRNLSQSGVFTTNSLAAPVTFTVANSPKMVALADIDGDGKLDVILTHNYNSGNQGLSVSRNISTPGNIAFATNVLFPASFGSLALAVGDVDGDGKPDVVVAAFNGQVISVYRNTSQPGTINSYSFAPRVDIQTGGWADWVALGDLSGNGKLDIAVAEQSPNQMELFQNLSAPGIFTSSSLAAPVVFGAGWDANSVLIGDFDGDGRPDIFMANGYSLNVSVYQNLDPFSGPPVFTEQPVSQTVLAGSAVTLTASARGATPLQYQWYFYHHSLSGATASSLSLGPVRAANAGDYSVTVKNRYGSITSTNAVVTVVRASDVSDAVVLPPGPSVQVVAEGKNVTLTWPVGASEVLTATNLAGPWQPLNVSLATNGFNISASVPATNQQQFFRLSGQ